MKKLHCIKLMIILLLLSNGLTSNLYSMESEEEHEIPEIISYRAQENYREEDGEPLLTLHELLAITEKKDSIGKNMAINALGLAVDMNKVPETDQKSLIYLGNEALVFRPRPQKQKKRWLDRILITNKALFDRYPMAHDCLKNLIGINFIKKNDK